MTAPRPRGRTAAQLAAHWGMSEARALEWLAAFARRGFARRRGAYWYPTERAQRLIGFGPEGE